MSLTMKLPTVPFIASVLELPGVASAFANKNCPCTRKTAEKKKKIQELFCQFIMEFL